MLALLFRFRTIDKLQYMLELLRLDFRDVIVAGEYDRLDGKLVKTRDFMQPLQHCTKIVC